MLSQDFGYRFALDTSHPSISQLPLYSDSIDHAITNYKHESSTSLVREGDDVINQCLVQEYYGHSIARHVDNTSVFGKEILTLSLVGDCVMTFEKVGDPSVVLSLPLEPNSLLIIEKEGRYMWKHGIRRKKHDERRISLTMRHLIQGL